jgi:hypothetical protein
VSAVLHLARAVVKMKYRESLSATLALQDSPLMNLHSHATSVLVVNITIVSSRSVCLARLELVAAP